MYVLAAVASCRRGCARALSMKKGKGIMKTKNASAGQDQRRTDRPPTNNTSPNNVGKRAKASSGSISRRMAMSRIPTPVNKTGRPSREGSHVAFFNQSPRCHNTTKAKTGTKKPWEYCGSRAQRSAIAASVVQCAQTSTISKTPPLAMAQERTDAVFPGGDKVSFGRRRFVDIRLSFQRSKGSISLKS